MADRVAPLASLTLGYTRANLEPSNADTHRSGHQSICHRCSRQRGDVRQLCWQVLLRTPSNRPRSLERPSVSRPGRSETKGSCPSSVPPPVASFPVRGPGPLPPLRPRTTRYDLRRPTPAVQHHLGLRLGGRGIPRSTSLRRSLSRYSRPGASRIRSLRCWRSRLRRLPSLSSLVQPKSRPSVHGYSQNCYQVRALRVACRGGGCLRAAT